MESVTFECQFNENARPYPIISWLYNEKPFKEDRWRIIYKNTLILKKVVDLNSGNYTCILSNGYHPQQRLVYNLTVLGKI